MSCRPLYNCPAWISDGILFAVGIANHGIRHLLFRELLRTRRLVSSGVSNDMMDIQHAKVPFCAMIVNSGIHIDPPSKSREFIN